MFKTKKCLYCVHNVIAYKVVDVSGTKTLLASNVHNDSLLLLNFF